jgi:hypothetical protein
MDTASFGFVALRGVLFMELFLGRKGCLTLEWSNRTIRYRGGDRLPWSDLLHPEAAELPVEFASWRDGFVASLVSIGAIDVQSELNRLSEVQSWIRKLDLDCEVMIVATSSVLPASASHVVDQYLGCDAIVDGYGSMIAVGVFQQPDLFPKTLDQINDSGLLRGEDSAGLLEQEYRIASQSRDLESFPARSGAGDLLHFWSVSVPPTNR